MEKYDLHKNDFSKLHFELQPMLPYYLKNKEKASKPHRHSFFQLLWFKNSGDHYVDYKIIRHPKNSLFTINQNQIHCFCPKSSNEGFLFHFNDSFIAKLSLEILARFSLHIFNEIDRSFLALSEKESIILKRQLKIISVELKTSKEPHSEVIMHQFLALLYKIEQIKKERFLLKSDLNADFISVVKFKQLIIDNIYQQMRISNYATALGITPKKLTLLAKRYLGTTPGALIKEMKILEAKRRLTEHQLSIKEIAHKVGFDQPTYFTKFFKKETGITPKQFQLQVL